MSFIACRHALRLIITLARCNKKKFLLINLFLRVYLVKGLPCFRGVFESFKWSYQISQQTCYFDLFPTVPGISYRRFTLLYLELHVGGVPYCTWNCLKEVYPTVPGIAYRKCTLLYLELPTGGVPYCTWNCLQEVYPTVPGIGLHSRTLNVIRLESTLRNVNMKINIF